MLKPHWTCISRLSRILAWCESSAPAYAPVLPKGTVLQITAWHDNTAGNKNNPDPRQWVTGGPRTVDEMAHHNAQIIYITEDDDARITEERKARQTTQTQP